MTSLSVPSKSITRILVSVGLILLIPLVGTLLNDKGEGQGWYWSPFDFVAMGTLLFIFGLAIDYSIRKVKNPAHRIFAVLGLLILLVIVWAELAVDAVGQVIGAVF